MKKSFALAFILVLVSSGSCFAKVVKEYFPNGKLQSVQVYYDEGGVKGPLKIYWFNGRMRQKTWYKHGLPYLTHTWAATGVQLQ